LKLDGIEGYQGNAKSLAGVRETFIPLYDRWCIELLEEEMHGEGIRFQDCFRLRTKDVEVYVVPATTDDPVSTNDFAVNRSIVEANLVEELFTKRSIYIKAILSTVIF
jgi:hypothetical protein